MLAVKKSEAFDLTFNELRNEKDFSRTAVRLDVDAFESVADEFKNSSGIAMLPVELLHKI